MKSIAIVTSFVTALLVFFANSSCNYHESIISTPDNSDPTKLVLEKESPCDPSLLLGLENEIYDSLFGEVIIDSSIIIPEAPECVYIQHMWVTHHFEPKPGKSIGIWPRENRFETNRISELKSKYGFNLIYHHYPYNTNHFNMIIQAGFKPDSIMVNIKADALPNNNWALYTDIVNAYNVKYYFIDEAVEHNCAWNNGFDYTPYKLNQIKNFIVNNRPTSEFVTSGYKRCGHLLEAGYYVDRVMYSAYSNWYLIDWLPAGCFSGHSWGASPELFWGEGSVDQRPSWTDMQNKFGNKFNMTWIGAHKDLSSYQELLGHGMNLNLDVVWLYQKEDITDDYSENNILSFCNAAWKAGFLRKFIQDVKIEWRCALPDCSCNPACFPNDYYISSIQYGTIQEVFP